MLLPGSQLLNLPVLSLQTGGEVARTKNYVVNPDNLFIEAIELTGPNLVANPAFLRIEDIREISEMGIIIDASDEIVELDDIITLKKLYQTGFEIVGIKVIDEVGSKVGKVNGLVLNSSNFIVQQISVQRPWLRSLGDTELLIHRGQIVNVTKDLITIKNSQEKLSNRAKNSYKYANPFRANQPTPSARPDSSTTNQ